MEQRTIHLKDYLQEVLTELHKTELRLAELRGQRDLLLRMMQPPIRTDGVEPPTPSVELAPHTTSGARPQPR